MEKMKGVVKFKDGKDGWGYVDVERNNPSANEVEIKVKCIGICGSELHLYHDHHFYTPGTVVGHEFSGEIARIGSEITQWKIGDRVVAQLDKGACGNCDFCRKGMPNFCPNGKAVGYDVDGGWAEYYCTPENMLIKIPDNVSFEEAAMAEPTNVICQALITRNTVKPGDVVLVQGCGTIGMLAAMVAKAIGAKTVIMTGTDVDAGVRLAVAEKLKAVDFVVNVNQESLTEKVAKISDCKGVDVIIEASGSDHAIYGMTDVLRKTGTIVVIGEAAKEKITLRWNDAVFKACNIVFCFGEVYESWRTAVNLMEAGTLELEKLITHRLSLKDFHKGFNLLETKQGLKVLLYPQGV